MPAATSILANTPAWVFMLFGYLTWQGVLALHPRRVPVWRLMIVPLVFIGLGVARAIGGRGDGTGPLLAWLAGAVALLPLGLFTGPRLLSIDRASGVVLRRGSPMPLIRNLTVFTLQYGAAVISALTPDSHTLASVLARAVSGASAGYFVGWAVAFWRRYLDRQGALPLDPVKGEPLKSLT